MCSISSDLLTFKCSPTSWRKRLNGFHKSWVERHKDSAPEHLTFRTRRHLPTIALWHWNCWRMHALLGVSELLHLVAVSYTHNSWHSRVEPAGCFVKEGTRYTLHELNHIKPTTFSATISCKKHKTLAEKYREYLAIPYTVTHQHEPRWK